MNKGSDKRNGGDELAERLLNFAVEIIKLVSMLPKTPIGKHISGQLLRSGTSSGANYEEARGAESRADFIHKLGIVLKEMKECRFWLRLVSRAQLVSSKHTEPLIQECGELCAIIAQSILTARAGK